MQMGQHIWRGEIAPWVTWISDIVRLTALLILVDEERDEI